MIAFAGDTLHDLCVEIRGKKSARGNLFAILLQVRDIADTIIKDFPGLQVDPELILQLVRYHQRVFGGASLPAAGISILILWLG